MWWPCFGHPELATTHPTPTLPRAVRATPPSCFQCSGNEIRRCRINMQTCFDERKNCAHVFLGNKKRMSTSPLHRAQGRTRGGSGCWSWGGGSDNTSPSLSFRPPQQRLEREGEGPSLREVLAPFRGSPVSQSKHGWLGASFVSLHHTTIASSFRLPANKWAATPTLPFSKFSLISGLQFGE